MIDAGAREQIRNDLESTLVVEAAAGTGKTTEMIARIIEVIRNGARLEQIVAVTFTEKAAGELKLRLRFELERARNEMQIDKRASAVTRERTRFENALAELEVARIGTIHSFCADLLRERPIEARVDPLFEIAPEDEADRMYQQAFDTWFQRTLAAPGEGVRRILRRTEPVDLLRNAGKGLVNRRDFDAPWRRDPFDRAAGIQRLLDELAGLGALASRALRPDDPLAKLFTKIDRWLADLARREALPDAVRDLDGLEAELAAVARWWEWRYSGRPKLYADDLPRADAIARRDAALASFAAFRQAADADLAALLHDELRPLVTEYTALVARAGRLDFFDLLLATRDLLARDAGVRADYQQRFTHYFVDEFQDTDPLQVEVLLLLAADHPATADPAQVRVRPGKLFLVGDPKQAIYRFRRADIALYEQVKARLVAGGAKLVELSTSFRAVPSLQAAINAAFAPVMTGPGDGQLDGQARYVPLSPHRPDVSSRPTLIALPVPEPYGKREIANKEIEKSYPDAVGAFVDFLLTRSNWKLPGRDGQPAPITSRDICLMFRRFQAYTTDLTRPYVRALEARQIPHVLVGGRSFHEREEVLAIRAALAALEWPDDELSVYATLRGPLFAFHDEDLLALKQQVGRLYPLEWIGRGAESDLAAALAILGELNVDRNRRPIADTLGRLLAATRAHAGFAMWPAGEQALANVLRVMDLARRFETARASRATSFRAFVERIEDDADRARQPDAMTVEEDTEGVRIMTVHKAKGLEFPIVILCDPTAPLSQQNPSHFIDPARRLWLESLAGCVPIELRERADEVLQRDREEGQRLAYVAATRARDVLVVPVVGDEERDSWLSALTPIVHPELARKRSPTIAPACPRFSDDSVLRRAPDCDRFPTDSVAPGRHLPRVGTVPVVWWDPRALELDRALVVGMRQRQILQADETKERSTASQTAHAAWQERRAAAIKSGSAASLIVRSITAAAKTANAGWDEVAIEDTGIDRTTRPRGSRFGTLVHAVLAGVELSPATPTVDTATRALATSHGRLVGATQQEIDAATHAVEAALRHPLIQRAAAAVQLRREVPVVLSTSDGMLEGIVDLAFADSEGWTIVDFKTDAELDGDRQRYEHQVRLYAMAIAHATGQPARAALLVV